MKNRTYGILVILLSLILIWTINDVFPCNNQNCFDPACTEYGFYLVFQSSSTALCIEKWISARTINTQLKRSLYRLRFSYA